MTMRIRKVSFISLLAAKKSRSSRPELHSPGIGHHVLSAGFTHRALLAMLVVHGARVRVGQDPAEAYKSATIPSLGSEAGSPKVSEERTCRPH